jgi:uncharacterized protein YndB with AHSA1/START domain
MTYDQSAQITAHLQASPAAVWSALTEPAALTAWYWPASLAPKATSEPAVGGRFGITTDATDMGFAGEYLELEPPRRIVQSWRWAGDDRDSRVTIELTPAGDGTDLVVTHAELDPETAERYRAGWQSCLDRLPAYLA